MLGSTPVSTTTLSVNQIPVSAVAVPGHSGGNLTTLRGANAANDSNGNELADASMAVADGSDINAGFTTDTAVVGDNTGTISAKLRGLNKIWNDVWDSTSHVFHLDLKQVKGAALSPTNPVITENNTLNWIRSGQQGYFASTDIYTPANINNAFSIFNPGASTKTLLVLSLVVIYGASSQVARARITGSNPSYGNTLSAANFDLGNLSVGGSTSPQASVTYATASTSVPALSATSIAYTAMQTATTATNELIPSGIPLVLAASNGLAVYFTNTATGNLCFSVKWIEF